MGRRTGFVGLMNAVARDVARAQRQAETARRRAEREAARTARLAASELRAAQRAQVASARAAKDQHLKARIEEVENRNELLSEKIDELSSILTWTLHLNDAIDFSALRLSEDYPNFSPAPDILRPRVAPALEGFLSRVSAPSGFQRFVPGAAKKYEAALAEAEREYELAKSEWDAREKQRVERLEEQRREYQKRRDDSVMKAKQRNAEVDEFQRAYLDGDSKAIIAYFTMVLERSEYPDGFPQSFRVAYASESKELAIEYELPPPAIIPSVMESRYNKTRDVIEEKPRKTSEIKERYVDLVASVALRTIHEIIESDTLSHVQVVDFNGFVKAVDPATGQDIRPCLISVRATRERFGELDLARVDKAACLRNLGAQVSARPDEIQPVKPIVEFDMIDRRFIEQQDVLDALESRPNLMLLTPMAFEHLVGNLFQQMGLETKMTRSSRDGGVDAVAFDARPILGGKVIIQAKRYKGTVGVSAVRDLYGTMLNEGASKGILVTTSGYGTDAFEFAKDKPIELIDGGGLLYLLEQVGTKAQIIMPEDV